VSGSVGASLPDTVVASGGTSVLSSGFLSVAPPSKSCTSMSWPSSALARTRTLAGVATEKR
jgi:hypothetical protein